MDFFRQFSLSTIKIFGLQNLAFFGKSKFKFQFSYKCTQYFLTVIKAKKRNHWRSCDQQDQVDTQGGGEGGGGEEEEGGGGDSKDNTTRTCGDPQY